MACMGIQDNGTYFDLRSVSKTFRLPLANPFKPRESVRALESVNLVIPRAKITCLLGPNGAGKTTLIKILAFLILPDEGTILYNGMPYEQVQKKIQGKIGLVTPNERAFYGRLSGFDNLHFYGSLNGFRGAKLRNRVDEVLGETGMTDSAAKPYRLYSAGMKQKLNIARALLGDPEIYLLDEPAAHLDPLAREEFQNFVTGTLVKKRGATVFLCTHDLEEARALADVIVVLDKGKVVAQGERRELLESIKTTKELAISYAGELPQKWLAEHQEDVRMESPGKLRVSFDPSITAQDALLASFIAYGGRLLEASNTGDSLLDLIKRMTGKHE